jgi:hypothetical protein
MPNNPRSSRRPRPLAVVGDDTLPDVRIDGVGTVPMSDEQYTAAVHSLAVLIDSWRVIAHTGVVDTEPSDADRPLAA